MGKRKESMSQTLTSVAVRSTLPFLDAGAVVASTLTASTGFMPTTSQEKHLNIPPAESLQCKITTYQDQALLCFAGIRLYHCCGWRRTHPRCADGAQPVGPLKATTSAMAMTVLSSRFINTLASLTFLALPRACASNGTISRHFRRCDKLTMSRSLCASQHFRGR